MLALSKIELLLENTRLYVNVVPLIAMQTTLSHYCSCCGDYGTTISIWHCPLLQTTKSTY